MRTHPHMQTHKYTHTHTVMWVWRVIYLKGAGVKAGKQQRIWNLFVSRTAVRDARTVTRTQLCHTRQIHQASLLWLGKKHPGASFTGLLTGPQVVFVDTVLSGNRWHTTHVCTNAHTQISPTEIVKPNIKVGVVDNNRTHKKRHWVKCTQTTLVLWYKTRQKTFRQKTFRPINVNGIHLYAKRFALWSQEKHWQIASCRQIVW